MRKNIHSQKLNITIIFMILLSCYLVYVIFIYSQKEQIFAYQVKSGSLAENSIYTGIILREEKIFTAASTGYIDYFAREGEHVGVGDLVYSIDESGIIDDMINKKIGDNNLSNEDLSSLRSDIIDFSNIYSNTNYYKTYDFLYDMNGEVLKLANMNILDALSDVNSSSLTNLVKLCNSEAPGYVVYNIDGYESLSVNGINEEMFDTTTYEKDLLINNELIDVGDEVFKLVTSEEWNIVIKLSKDKAEELADEGYIQIKFLENQRIQWAAIKVVELEDGYYGVLTLNNSVLNFCTDRYIEIELMSNAEQGLKIPISSLVHKEFFLVPKEYIFEEGEDNIRVFLKKSFLEDGTVSAERLELEVYSETDDYYYVDNSILRTGDYLIKPDSLEEYPVSTRGELVGVYNMNKGYADFRQVVILYENEEYAIVKSNTVYGLNVYDFIVLDSSTVVEDEFIYE